MHRNSTLFVPRRVLKLRVVVVIRTTDGDDRRRQLKLQGLDLTLCEQKRLARVNKSLLHKTKQKSGEENKWRVPIDRAACLFHSTYPLPTTKKKKKKKKNIKSRHKTPARLFFHSRMHLNDLDHCAPCLSLNIKEAKRKTPRKTQTIPKNRHRCSNPSDATAQCRRAAAATAPSLAGTVCLATTTPLFVCCRRLVYLFVVVAIINHEHVSVAE
jgi:hypothetical protein